MKNLLHHGVRVLSLIVLSALALQLYFLARVALMGVVDPQSTTFQRSEIRRLAAASDRARPIFSSLRYR